MTSWEIVKYFIDCKKDIDSIIYISENVKLLSNLNLRRILDSRLRDYYIKIRVVYDKSIAKCQQKELCKTDPILERTMHEVDKNYAHKDDDYVPNELEFRELIDTLKQRLEHCKELCNESLPSITIDYVPYDRDLYRFINGIKEIFENRRTPYFIPTAHKRSDYKFNIFKDLINDFRNEWVEEYRPLFRYIKSPTDIYNTSRTNGIMITSCADDIDEIECEAFISAFRRRNQYKHVIKSLYCAFISKLSTEIDRITLVVLTELGYKSKDFNFNSFVKFSDGLQNDKQGKRIHELIALSKIDSAQAKPKFQETDVTEIIKSVAYSFAPAFENGQKELKTDLCDETMVSCDEKQMRKVVSNLISNAFKFCKTTVTVKCAAVNGKARITISDDGEGIAKEDLPHVFERFYTGRKGNTGIGLALTKEIIGFHEGEIRAYNQNGAVFEISLAISKEQN